MTTTRYWELRVLQEFGGEVRRLGGDAGIDGVLEDKKAELMRYLMMRDETASRAAASGLASLSAL